MNDSILTRIYAARRESVARAERETPTGALQRLASELPPARNFARALRQPPYGLIAEVKKGSPSRGMFRDDLDPAALAAQYVAGGAAAISVVTEPEFFFGALGWIGAIRREVELPILRKDFLFCEYQIWESRAAGADAVLLILAMLDDADADRLLGVAQDAGLQCLVEVHNEAETQRACDLGASLVGVNNRDLKTFEVKLETSERLAIRLPADAVKVAESGICTRDNCVRLAAAGYHAFLVGEALVTAADPAGLLHELRGNDAAR